MQGSPTSTISRSANRRRRPNAHARQNPTASFASWRVNAYPPSKNSVWNVFGETHSRTSVSWSQVVGPHREIDPDATTTAQDVEYTALYYYGYRFYDRALGRWVSRDPAGEKAGPNQYATLANDALDRMDVLGRTDFTILTIGDSRMYGTESHSAGAHYFLDSMQSSFSMSPLDSVNMRLLGWGGAKSWQVEAEVLGQVGRPGQVAGRNALSCERVLIILYWIGQNDMTQVVAGSHAAGQSFYPWNSPGTGKQRSIPTVWGTWVRLYDAVKHARSGTSDRTVFYGFNLPPVTEGYHGGGERVVRANYVLNGFNGQFASFAPADTGPWEYQGVDISSFLPDAPDGQHYSAAAISPIVAIMRSKILAAILQYGGKP